MFGVLPGAVAHDLDRDPEQLTLRCMEVLHYADAFEAFQSANKDRIKAWGADPMMAEVTEREFIRAGGDMGDAVEPDGQGVEGDA